MKVSEITEHEDGSATLQLEEISAEELKLLIEEGFKSLITKYAAELEEQAKVPALLKK